MLPSKASTVLSLQPYQAHRTILVAALLSFRAPCLLFAMACRCPDCQQLFKHKRSLSVHRSKYGGSCAWEMPDAEFDLLSPVPGNHREVQCNHCGYSFSKRSVFEHLHNYHPELEEDAWNWWTIKGDYNLLKNKRRGDVVLDQFSPYNVGWARRAGHGGAPEAEGGGAPDAEAHAQAGEIEEAGAPEAAAHQEGHAQEGEAHMAEDEPRDGPLEPGLAPW